MGSAARPEAAGTGAATLDRGPVRGFRHEALLHSDEDEFLATALPFIEGGQDEGEPVLVMVGPAKLDGLRRHVDRSRGVVKLVDMTTVGENPARIIPAWRNFVVEQSAAGASRGIGEPIWPDRRGAELAEAQRHEALLNVAFAGADLWLLCSYDVTALPAPVVAGAHRHHPHVRTSAGSAASRAYPGVEVLAGPCTDPLVPLPAGAPWLGFDAGSVREVRAFVAAQAGACGLVGERAADLVLAVHEVTTNSVRHGGGRGELTIWRDGDVVLCEVQDHGRITDPLADRTAPRVDAEGGRGLWLANSLCDLVQLRSFPGRTVVRLHRRRR